MDEVEIRDDEEQALKLQEIIDLLLAAGYFRARIKTLSSFDKVVGGMVWCIQTCNFDVDVDLLFQENSSIGQKISLTEKIVAVLPRMKCPFAIEPHQIQGLDFIHIFPVIQWLVKKAIETREEMGDYIRSFSLYQFGRCANVADDAAPKNTTVKYVKDAYSPVRLYRRRVELELGEEQKRVRSTLLEYGWKVGIVGGDDKSADQSSATKDADLVEDMSKGGSARVAASVVGSMVEMQQDAIREVASAYAEKEAELRAQMAPEERHTQRVENIRRKLAEQEKEYERLKEAMDSLSVEMAQKDAVLSEVRQRGEQVAALLRQLDQIEQSADVTKLAELKRLIALNETLKKKETEFKAECKKEAERLQKAIDELKSELEAANDERLAAINKQIEVEKERLQKVKLQLAARNREVAILQRKIDIVPSRAELSQYQRRFLELYNQMGATHKETKQYYTLYNTLDDTKLYYNKEISLLNSIHDNFPTAMQSASAREQFLKQLEQIVEGVKQNRVKVEKRRQEEKMKRDTSNESYLRLVNLQRQYVSTVKDFQEQCRRNETLQSKLRE